MMQDGFQILTGDSLEVLPTLDADSFDSCVCDPPYELGFMGKAWDKSGIANNVDLWRAVYRVLKPGAYLLAFGGSRTYHRMACAIEDAGFEIRDQIQWIYGSGFPKSLDVSKQIDKMAGAEREKIPNPLALQQTAAVGTNAYQDFSGKATISPVAVTDDAKTWDGFGTALKPAHEPIVMARKPLEKGLTVAQNVLKWGTGAINVDGCRIPANGDSLTGGMASNGQPRVSEGWDRPWMHDPEIGKAKKAEAIEKVAFVESNGRFPANVIHDGSVEVLSAFPYTASGQPMGIKAGGQGNAFGAYAGGIPVTGYGDEGSAARFFYSPKASKYDREAGLREAAPGEMTDRKDGSDGLNSPRAGAGRTNGGRNVHPTVKPTDLMQYLCRLVTPPGGLILDPFLGSGSTVKAALIERFKCVGIELNPEYAEIAKARLNSLQVKLF